MANGTWGKRLGRCVTAVTAEPSACASQVGAFGESALPHCSHKCTNHTILLSLPFNCTRENSCNFALEILLMGCNYLFFAPFLQ
jgi:hypothetical protein